MKLTIRRIRTAMIRWRALPNELPRPDEHFFDRPSFYLREVKP